MSLVVTGDYCLETHNDLKKHPFPYNFGLLWIYWYGKTCQNDIPKGLVMGHTYF